MIIQVNILYSENEVVAANTDKLKRLALNIAGMNDTRGWKINICLIGYVAGKTADYGRMEPHKQYCIV